jgi:hypothetical protein
VPLAGQRDHATLWLASQHPEPGREAHGISPHERPALPARAPLPTAGPGGLLRRCLLARPAAGRLGTGGSASGARLLSGLGGRLGRLGGGLLAHGRLELLLAGQGGGQLVGVLERPANQRLAVGGSR